MEAQAAGGGFGEVRKVHIVYFLSHKGRIDQPHLIRVHHHSRNGVRLRDVKRWLSELRGKDMPESFAWSYKRKYKSGYVWQDLLDEDLITPISDNEYVLKGSQISSIAFANDFGSYVEKDVSNRKTSPPFEVDIKEPKTPLPKVSLENSSTNSSSKTSFEVEELPSFGSETSTEDTPKQQQDYKYFDAPKAKDNAQNQKEAEVNSILEAFLNKNKINDNSNKKDTNKSSPSSNYSFRKSSSYSSLGATHMFLNLLTCGIVDTNDSVVTVRRKSNVETNCGQVVKGDMFGGSARVNSTSHWTNLEQQRDNRKERSKTSCNTSESNNNVKTIPAAYKFANGPYCSQCSRGFNPEKLHTHMKSCRGMKALAKAAKRKT